MGAHASHRGAPVRRDGLRGGGPMGGDTLVRAPLVTRVGPVGATTATSGATTAVGATTMGATGVPVLPVNGPLQVPDAELGLHQAGPEDVGGRGQGGPGGPGGRGGGFGEDDGVLRRQRAGGAAATRLHAAASPASPRPPHGRGPDLGEEPR